jgi:glycosyltransferase involved in cell wall biosynthesis
LHYIRLWDVRTANGVNEFAANSGFISRRISKVYRRDSKVIYPPVDVSSFDAGGVKEDFYLTASRMVPYKKMPLIVEAFSAMPQRKLVVIGDGPEMQKCHDAAGPNVTLLGYQSSSALRDYMQRARAFVFAAEEDFGITPVEAQACGTPVIAYGRGGALETVLGAGAERPTGLFFEKQSTEAIIEAVNRFESNLSMFDPQNCRTNALRFGEERFRKEFTEWVDAVVAQSR